MELPHTRKPTIEDLPYEILQHIFGFVQSKDQKQRSTLVPILFVNRRWKHYLLHAFHYKQIASDIHYKQTASDIMEQTNWKLLKWTLQLWVPKITIPDGKIGIDEWFENLAKTYHLTPIQVADHAYRRASFHHEPIAAYHNNTLRQKDLQNDIERSLLKCLYCEEWNHRHSSCPTYENYRCALCGLKKHPEWVCKYLPNFVNHRKMKTRFKFSADLCRWVSGFSRQYGCTPSIHEHYKSILSTKEVLQAMKDFKIVQCWICGELGHPSKLCSNKTAIKDFFADKDTQIVMKLYAKKKWTLK